MKIITLTRGQVAIVDDEDFDRLNKYDWHASPDRDTFYARRTDRSTGKVVTVRMHREIINASEGMEVDHINGNCLDNRKCNLRICSRAENMRNKRRYKNNTSGFKGVSWVKKLKKWLAYIRVNGKRIHLKLCSTPVEAAQVYDLASLDLHGKFAKTNFCRGLYGVAI